MMSSTSQPRAFLNTFAGFRFHGGIGLNELTPINRLIDLTKPLLVALGTTPPDFPKPHRNRKNHKIEQSKCCNPQWQRDARIKPPRQGQKVAGDDDPQPVENVRFHQTATYFDVPPPRPWLGLAGIKLSTIRSAAHTAAVAPVTLE